MSINGKRDNFTLNDLIKVGQSISIKNPKKIIDDVISVVSKWEMYAKKANLESSLIKEIGENHRLDIVKPALEDDDNYDM